MRVLMVAGEPSGDAHAAPVAAQLAAAGAEVVAVGGPALAATGAEMVGGIDELAVIGFVEVAARLPHILALARRLEARLHAQRFDLFLPVDYPGFNLRFAARARRAGVPVLHYIGPQVWAWRAGRLRQMRRVATHVALILPFEKPLYDAAGVPATFVGHPLLDAITDEPVDADRDLGLFPGSRAQEIRRHLPLLLEAASRLRAERPGLRVLLSCAPAADRAALAAALAAHGFDPVQELSTAPARLALRRCRANLVASGTATLEAALAGRPFAVLYATGRLNYAVARRLVRLPYVALANLVAERPVVREYLQGDARPESLADEARRLLDDDTERARIAVGLADVRARLGSPGAAARVAVLARDVVSGVRPS